jgi:hypothetical protein
VNHPRSLVAVLKSLIERTYGIPPVIPDLAPFIVGDQGFRQFYPHTALESAGVRARVLVRDTFRPVRAVFYCPDSLVRHLERYNPLHGLGDVNIMEFGVLVEEIDHLITLASRVFEHRPVSLLELEHHANVTKYLTVLHFLGRQTGRRKVADSLRHWARHHLFERLSREEGPEAKRYREAARLAWQYLKVFETLRPQERRAEIRAFHRRPFRDILYRASTR